MGKLTKRFVDGLAPKAKPYSEYCSELKGFGVRVMPTGIKTWILDYRPHPGGRGTPKRRLTLGRANVITADQARELARANLEMVRLGKDPARDKSEARAVPLFKDFAERYLTEHAANKLKASTQVAYASLIRSRLIPAFGSERLNTIRRRDVKQLHKEISEKHPTTANRAIEVLKSIFNFAHDLEIVPVTVNPTEGIEANREQARERYLNDEEMARLLATLDLMVKDGLPWIADPASKTAKHLPKGWETQRVKYDYFVQAAFVLYLFTGCRLREILNLQWADVDLEGRAITIRDGKTGRREVMMNDRVHDTLELLIYFDHQKDRHGKFVIPGANIGTDKEKPRADLNRPWRHIRAAAGLDGLRIHDLRHNMASWSIAAGNDLYATGKLLGHSSIQSTQRYAHLLQEQHRRASAATMQAMTAAASAVKPGGSKPARKRNAAQMLGLEP